jgi:Sec7-like guanine-nucleotide exchange factor
MILIMAQTSFLMNRCYTDAHSPKVKNKMTKESFLRNTRDLLKQGLSKQYLSQCYDNIVKNEIKGLSFVYLS